MPTRSGIPRASIRSMLARVVPSWQGPGNRDEFVAAGDLTAYADVGHLASAAGLAPVPRDSGRRTGNLYRLKR